jgi:serine/threonine protein kinase
MANLSGKNLGKVQVGDLIARGGMAEVYLGEHTALNRKVAVKIMRDHVETDADNRMRFEREARVVAGLRHPNIIQVFDYEIIDGQPCLVMEYIPGASLGGYLKALGKRGEKLPQPMIARIVSALASAIDYAHSQHIIHRDLKPANVLLRSASGPVDPDQPLPADVEPILTDFGLVRLLDSSIQTATGTVSGTPAYMSPEQARGDKLDGTSDLYSFGVMLYEMLAGVVPFEAESSLGVLMKHLNNPPPPIADISSDLQAVIHRALAKDAQARFASAKEMADEFTAVFNGETASKATLKLLETAQTPPEPQTVREKKSTRRFNWNYLFGGLILLAFVFVAYRYRFSPSVNADQPIGRIVYADFNDKVDKATISITGLPALEFGVHYEAWFLSQGGETRRNVGKITLDAGGQGQLVFIDSNQRNILAGFDQVEITVEPNNDPAPDESSGEIAASSVFPPLALVHARHLLARFDSTPDSIALIPGLWRAADDLDVSVQELQKAYADGNEKLFRQKIEEVINQISGSRSAQYKDWNGDGTVDDPSDHYGLLFNGEEGYTEQGYLPQAASHAIFATQALDATGNIKAHSAHVVTCTENMTGWSRQMLGKALQLQEMPFGADMQPLVNEITALSIQILVGVDSNGNELIEPILGEGGADTAYEHAYYMADMPLLLGAHRIPAPAATKAK